MLCPYCNSLKTRVIDKRATEESKSIRRRRKCMKCENRFTTYERIRPIWFVLKRNKRKEDYDRSKLKSGIMKAVDGRPVTEKQVDRLIEDLESELKNMNTLAIKSKVIGDLVTEKLKKLDKVSYVRFMSFYKKYSDIKTFKKELGR